MLLVTPNLLSLVSVQLAVAAQGCSVLYRHNGAGSRRCRGLPVGRTSPHSTQECVSASVGSRSQDLGCACAGWERKKPWWTFRCSPASLLLLSSSPGHFCLRVVQRLCWKRSPSFSSLRILPVFVYCQDSSAKCGPPYICKG